MTAQRSTPPSKSLIAPQCRLYALLADALQYPGPGRLERLEAMIQALSSDQTAEQVLSFLAHIQALSLGEWEELYTRTWDLDPLTPPYIGYQIWGEDYRRGAFLARLVRAYRDVDLPRQDELADHLAPVLLYLASGGPPVPELDEVFDRAVHNMIRDLQEKDPTNPYLHLLNTLVDLE